MKRQILMAAMGVGVGSLLLVAAGGQEPAAAAPPASAVAPAADAVAAPRLPIDLKDVLNLQIIPEQGAVDAPGTPPGDEGEDGSVIDVPPALQKLFAAIEFTMDDDYASATPLFEEVLRLDPTQLGAWGGLGWCYWYTGEPQKCLDLWGQLRALSPNNPAPYRWLGIAHTALGHLGEAEAVTRRSLELDNTQLDVWFSLAQIYRWTGQYEKAIKILRDLSGRDANRMDYRRELAYALLQYGQFREALPLWRSLRTVSPDDADYMEAEALTLLRLGELEAAVEVARLALEANPENVKALRLMADVYRYQGKREEAIDALRKIVAVEKQPDEKAKALALMVELYRQLWVLDPQTHPLERPIRLTAELMELQPDHPEWKMLHAEFLLLNLQPEAAERAFRKVLEEHNPDNLRAHHGLFETYLVLHDYSRGMDEFKVLRKLTPRNPYIYYALARLESACGHYERALAALDRLEAVGERGAAMVVMYNNLIDSEWSDMVSLQRFRDQMAALKQHGFEFVTPEQIPTAPAPVFRTDRSKKDRGEDPAALEGEGAPPDTRRLVAVAFDRPYYQTLALATPTAESLGVKMTVFANASDAEERNPQYAQWADLQRLAASGFWKIGSALMGNLTHAAVDEKGTLAGGLANRIWRADENRLETEPEFRERLQRLYRDSRALPEARLPDRMEYAVAYPNGDVGHLARSNVPNALQDNLREAATNFRAGFIQSVFGFAVAGDNPLLYQSFFPARDMDGPALVTHYYRYHPVFLARRTRAELAALQGKLYLARDTLDELREAGYPEDLVEETEKFVYRHLTLRFGTATEMQTKKQTKVTDFTFDNPFVGLRGEYFRDNIGRRNWRLQGEAGMQLTARVAVEGFAGVGKLDQNYTEVSTNANPGVSHSLTVSERTVGARVGYSLVPDEIKASPVHFSAELAQRTYADDADQEEMVYAGEIAFRPLLPLDMLARYEHDMIPSARSVVEGVSYDLMSVNGLYRLTDWWDLRSALSYYSMSDDNSRTHFLLETKWEIKDTGGIHIGGRYLYADSDQHREDYWTPTELNEYLILLGVRNNYGALSYSLTFSAGFGKESVSAEEEQAYEDLKRQAEAQKWDPGPPPERGWDTIYGVEGSLQIQLKNNLQLFGVAAYNKGPVYNEFLGKAGLRLLF